MADPNHRSSSESSGVDHDSERDDRGAPPNLPRPPLPSMDPNDMIKKLQQAFLNNIAQNGGAQGGAGIQGGAGPSGGYPGLPGAFNPWAAAAASSSNASAMSMNPALMAQAMGSMGSMGSMGNMGSMGMAPSAGFSLPLMAAQPMAVGGGSGSGSSSGSSAGAMAAPPGG